MKRQVCKKCVLRQHEVNTGCVHESSTHCCHLLVGERIASLQPCLKPGSTPMMTQPLTGHTNRRCRRFRTNMAIDSFSAVLVSLVLQKGNARERQERWAEGWGNKKSIERCRGKKKKVKERVGWGMGKEEEEGAGIQCKWKSDYQRKKALRAHTSINSHTWNTCNSWWEKAE